MSNCNLAASDVGPLKRFEKTNPAGYFYPQCALEWGDEPLGEDTSSSDGENSVMDFTEVKRWKFGQFGRGTTRTLGDEN